MDWSDITIGQFQELTSIKNGVYDYAIEKEIAVISCITGIGVDELEARPKTTLLDIAKDTEFIKQPIPDRLRGSFNIGMKRFDIQLNSQNISAEQFILLNKYTTDEANTIENMHYIMAVLTNQKRWFKSLPFSEDFEGKAQLFKEKLSIGVAYPAAVFFCKVYKSWLDLIETYLIQKAVTMKKEMEKMISQ